MGSVGEFFYFVENLPPLSTYATVEVRHLPRKVGCLSSIPPRLKILLWVSWRLNPIMAYVYTIFRLRHKNVIFGRILGQGVLPCLGNKMAEKELPLSY